MNNHPAPTTPADDLLEHARQLVTDLVEVCQRLPVDSAEAEPVAKIMDRLAEECAQAAAMLRSLPGRPREQPGYSFAAIITAAETEHDFGCWLADLLCRAAAFRGSADHLVMGRSGSWEAEHVTALVRQTAGPLPGDLDRFKDGAPQ